MPKWLGHFVLPPLGKYISAKRLVVHTEGCEGMAVRFYIFRIREAATIGIHNQNAICSHFGVPCHFRRPLPSRQRGLDLAQFTASPWSPTVRAPWTGTTTA